MIWGKVVLGNHRWLLLALVLIDQAIIGLVDILHKNLADEARLILLNMQASAAGCYGHVEAQAGGTLHPIRPARVIPLVKARLFPLSSSPQLRRILHLLVTELARRGSIAASLDIPLPSRASIAIHIA